MGEDAEADEVCAVTGFKLLAFDGVDVEAEVLGEVGFELWADVGEEASVVGEEGEVVGVAEVFLGVELAFAVVVEAVEVDICEELAGEVTDGQSALSGEGRKKVVAGEVDVAGFLGVAIVDDEIEEP